MLVTVPGEANGLPLPVCGAASDMMKKAMGMGDLAEQDHAYTELVSVARPAKLLCAVRLEVRSPLTAVCVLLCCRISLLCLRLLRSSSFLHWNVHHDAALHRHVQNLEGKTSLQMNAAMIPAVSRTPIPETLRIGS